jgi:hypothetical protein
LHYQQTLEELIRTHTWGCCKKRVQTHFEFITIGNTDNSDGDIDFLDLLNGYPRYQTGTVTASHDGDETWTINDTGVPETWTVTSTAYNPPETGWSVGSATSDEATVAYPQPVYDWTEKFILPADCLRPLSFSATDESTIYYKFNDEWTIEGRSLLTNYDQGYLLYLKEPTIAEMDSLFIRAFVVLLASKLAVPIAGDRKMKIDLINEFDQVIMPGWLTANGWKQRCHRAMQVVHGLLSSNRVTEH